MARPSPGGFVAAEYRPLRGGRLINRSGASGTPEDANGKRGWNSKSALMPFWKGNPVHM